MSNENLVPIKKYDYQYFTFQTSTDKLGFTKQQV
jgi:hypothetical protein